ncbi:hypothetical protein GOV08_01680 [Candidatus Woesearchaeota archaeon]|nr:hypothetical protein [Candidatus Woesearchaeota archaeon]
MNYFLIKLNIAETTLKKTDVNFKVRFSEKFIQLDVGTKKTGEQIEVYSDDEYLLAAKVGKNGVVKVRANSDIGQDVQKAIKNSRIKIVLS